MSAELSRRQLLKGGAALVVSWSLLRPAQVFAEVVSDTGVPEPSSLSSWLSIGEDGSVTLMTGKVEIGMGVETGYIQIVAEELDVPVQSISVVMGDTARTVDQGGVGGSTSIERGAQPIRHAAAEARRVMLDMAAASLDVPASTLSVHDGIISAEGSEKRISYAEIIGGKQFKKKLNVSGSGFSLDVGGKAAKPKSPTLKVHTPAKLKAPQHYKVVGQSVPRVDIAKKAYGNWKYVVDVRVPGMAHGRPVRPPAIGAPLLKVDETSVKDVPGLIKVVQTQDFVGVVAETEWAAIQAAQRLDVKWGEPKGVFPKRSDVYAHMRSMPIKATSKETEEGDVKNAAKNATNILESTYEWPFQSHATMGPGCAVADIKPEGTSTVWSGVQKPHYLLEGIAELVGVPADTVRVIWTEDAGSYGRPGFADVAADAALLSKAVGRPVRVQWMRSDMTAWGAKGPAVIFDMRGGLDKDGKLALWDYTSRAFSGGEIYSHPNRAGNLLAGQLIGFSNATYRDEFAQYGDRSANYAFPNERAIAHTVAPLYPVASPLRTTHLRDPEGPAVTFAVECFLDELAVAAKIDPIELRKRYLHDDRAKDVMDAAARKAGWHPRPASKEADKTAGATAVGQGVAFATRGKTYVATIAEVEVNRDSGDVYVRKIVCAQDCGLIVNPKAVQGTVEANLIQSISRAIREEVDFNSKQVTSVDWVTYPIVRSNDVPESVEVVLINRKDVPSSGAGEPTSRPTAAAIANAIYDATGARLRQAPFTADRVKAAMA